MRTKTGNAILKILRQHIGSTEAITAPDICRELGLPVRKERQVRQIIADENALWADVLICATPGQGYFCAATFEEIAAYDNWLAGLSASAADKLVSFRRAAKGLGFVVTALPPLAAAA